MSRNASKLVRLALAAAPRGAAYSSLSCARSATALLASPATSSALAASARSALLPPAAQALAASASVRVALHGAACRLRRR
jgi:hypothetical protein